LLSLGDFNLSENTLSIFYDSPEEIAGFEFNITGLSIVEIFGGVSENVFNVDYENNKILGFSIEGNTLPPGQNELLMIQFNQIINQFTYIENNAVLSYPDGDGQFIVNVLGEIDHGIQDCQGEYYGDSHDWDYNTDLEGNLITQDQCINGFEIELSDNQTIVIQGVWNEYSNTCGDGICDEDDECVGLFDDDLGCILNAEHPMFFTLSQNYPNPFNPFTSIDFSIPTSDYLIMFIYNIQGHLFKKIINNEFYLSGSYTKTIDASALNSGLYFVQLKTSFNEKTVKITVIK
jgi:hypothetical protein